MTQRLTDVDICIEKIKQLPVTYDAETVQRCIEIVSNSPTIDAVPVKRGMWTFIRLTDKDWGHKAKECSSCGSTFFDTRKWNYCPNCGARMDKE
jgi:ribosomal protein S27AE